MQKCKDSKKLLQRHNGIVNNQAAINRFNEKKITITDKKL